MNSLIRSVAAVVALMVVSLVHAAELVVPTQYPSIQAAINASVTGDIITVRPGTYNERLDIGGRNITLRSLLGPNATIIDPQGVGGVVIQSANAAANGWVLQGFTIRNGLDSALYVSGVTATVRNCKFINNQASRGGGAHVRAGANVTFENCEFTQNRAQFGDSRGGAIYLELSNSTMRNSSLVSNSATSGYAGGGAVWLNASTIVVEDSQFTDNLASTVLGSCQFSTFILGAAGGAIGSEGTGSLEIRRASFLRNRIYASVADTCPGQGGIAYAYGGAIGVGAGATLHVESSQFNSDVAAARARNEDGGFQSSRAFGGAIYAAGPSATITDCQFVNTAAEALSDVGNDERLAFGAAVYTESVSACVIFGCTFGAPAQLGDSPNRQGGALYCNGTLHCANSMFQECRAGHGGAIVLPTSALVDFAHCEFSGCIADGGFGGAIWLVGGQRNFTNCTFTSNIAQGGGDHRGGAVYAEGGAQLNFTDCGFTGNRALSTGDNADRWTWGGACAMFGVTPRYTRCTFTDNAAISTGNGGGWRRAHGGATAEYDSDAVFTDCVFTSNRSETVGNGAQWSRGGTVHLWNSDSDFVRTTISDGRALPLTGSSSGGGVWMENVSRPGFTYCTITHCDGRPC